MELSLEGILEPASASASGAAFVVRRSRSVLVLTGFGVGSSGSSILGVPGESLTNTVLSGTVRYLLRRCFLVEVDLTVSHLKQPWLDSTMLSQRVALRRVRTVLQYRRSSEELYLVTFVNPLLDHCRFRGSLCDYNYMWSRPELSQHFQHQSCLHWAIDGVPGGL